MVPDAKKDRETGLTLVTIEAEFETCFAVGKLALAFLPLFKPLKKGLELADKLPESLKPDALEKLVRYGGKLIRKLTEIIRKEMPNPKVRAFLDELAQDAADLKLED